MRLPAMRAAAGLPARVCDQGMGRQGSADQASLQASGLAAGGAALSSAHCRGACISALPWPRRASGSSREHQPEPSAAGAWAQRSATSHGPSAAAHALTVVAMLPRNRKDGDRRPPCEVSVRLGVCDPEAQQSHRLWGLLMNPGMRYGRMRGWDPADYGGRPAGLTGGSRMAAGPQCAHVVGKPEQAH